MNRILTILLFSLIVTISYGQRNLYIATNGSDVTGTGSISAPYATLQRAINNVRAGDTINFRGGTYNSLAITTLNPLNSQGVSGKVDSIITFRSYPGEWAIFDCSQHCSQPNPPGYNSWLSLNYAQFLHFKNFEVKNVFQCQYVNSAVIAFSECINLTFEHVIIHDISTPRGYGLNGGGYKTWTDNRPEYGGPPYWNTSIDTTRWINCDVYNTCDTLGGGNAGDGWKVVFYGNNYTEWDGCRVWNFSDDGIDANSIDGSELVVKNTWVMSTQKYERYDIEGNGFKFTAMYDNYSYTHSDQFPFLKLWDNIAVDNNYYGYYDNLYVGGYQHLNTQQIGNISYKNRYGIRTNYNPVLGNRSSSNFKNNISFRDGTRNSGGTQAYGSGNNYSVVNFTDSITLDEWNFLSVDPGELIKPRKADGSLPDVNFFRPRTGSPLINAGSPIVAADSSSYVRDSLGVSPTHPDIGPWEYLGPANDTNEDILSFTFPNQSGYTTYDYVNNEVHATIFYANRGTLSSLTPIVLPTDGDTISPGFKTVVNFSSQPVTYRVSNIANSGQYEDWDVYIDTAVASSYKDVRTFYLNNFVYSINATTAIVSIYYMPGSDLSNLRPTFTLDRGATSNPASGSLFTFPDGEQDVIVTAEDGSTKTWTFYLTELAVTDVDGIVGYTIPFTEAYTTSRNFYSRYIAKEEGTIDRLRIYHFGGTGNLNAAVYSGGSSPSARLASVSAVAVNANEGWQTITLSGTNTTNTIEVGDTIWIGIAFQNTVNFGVVGNLPFFSMRANLDSYGYGYTRGFRDPADASTAWNFITSVYALYDFYDDPDPDPDPDPNPDPSTGTTVKYGGKILKFNNKIIKF